MMLPIRLISLERLDVAMIVFWVTWMYCRVTWKSDVVVVKNMGNWFVVHMEMLVPCTDVAFG